MFVHKHINDYTAFFNNNIDQEMHKRADKEYIKLKRQDLKNQMKELDELEKSSKENSEEVKKILKTGYDHYNMVLNSPAPSYDNIRLYLRSNILPKLKKANCNRYDVDQLLEMFSKGGP